jgi:macrolide-specific efflux system membrane fusion protein
MKKWVGAVLAAVLLLAAGYWVFRSGRKPSALMNDQEIQVTKGDLQSKILSTGVVQPENRLEIKAPIPGRVDKVLVDEGYNVKKGQVLAIMSSTERAALLDVARSKGPGELKKWEDYYQAAPIMAAIGGTVILRNVQPGQTVTSSDTLLVMSDRLTVKAQVDETDIAEIVLKQDAHIVLDAYPDRPVDAHVDQVAFDATTVNNVTTYVVDVLPDKAPPFMRSGMTANVTFFVESREGVLRVPNSAIQLKDGRSYARMRPSRKGGEPELREVKTGLNDGKLTEILSGLSEGDTVLIPQLKSEGDTVSKSPANPLNPLMGGGRRPH